MKKREEKRPELLEVATKVKNLPVSARKLRLIVEEVKKIDPLEAIRKLKFLNKKGALFLIKGIKTVLADAENNFGLDKETVVFKEILVGEGKRLKRRDFSHGARFNGGLIQKPRTHLVIKVIGEKKSK